MRAIRGPWTSAIVAYAWMTLEVAIEVEIGASEGEVGVAGEAEVVLVTTEAVVLAVAAVGGREMVDGVIEAVGPVKGQA